MKQLLFLTISLLLLIIPSSYAQEFEEVEELYEIETVDGNEFIGKITYEDEEIVRIQTRTLGELSIPRKNIKRLRPLRTHMGADGSLWEENLQATRYFWAPNGHGLRKGEGYYQNLWVFFNQASVGITDNISIGAGVMPFFLLGGAPTPVWITPKISVPIVKDVLSLGGGALVGTVVGQENSGFGILYGVSTVGSRDLNMTIGLGYGYLDGELANAPLINVSGMARISRKWYLLTENYRMNFGNEILIIASAGARKMINNVGLDFGLFTPVFSEMGINDFYGIPWLGFSVPMGKAR